MSLASIARMTMGTTLGFHIILAVTGLALPFFVLTAEYIGIRRQDSDFYELARRGSRALVLIFAVAAVTGTLVAAELGVMWSRFMGFSAQVVVLPFFIEAFAFLTEGFFIGVYVYGWDQFKNPWIHWISGIPVAIAATASGLLITMVNVWMNHPEGFRLIHGQVTDVKPWHSMWNEAMLVANSHVLFMAYSTVAMMLMAIGSYILIKRPNHPYYRKATAMAAGVGTVVLAATIFTGDMSGKWLAHYQPEKLAAAEALFKSRPDAPFVFGGIVNMATQTISGGLKIPGLLSWLAYVNVHHRVTGLDHFPRAQWPPVPWVHLTFDTMVSFGSFILGVSAFMWFLNWRGKSWPKWLLWLGVLSGPLAVLAMEAGWLTDELGRQPWVVYDIMPTVDGITVAPGVAIAGVMIMILLIALSVSVPWMLWIMFKGIPDYTSHPPTPPSPNEMERL